MLPRNPTIEEFGVGILFLPVVIVISLVVLGLFLFVIIQVLSLFIRIPETLFKRSVEKETQAKEDFSSEAKIKPEAPQLDREELWFRFKSGNWIFWVALLPLVIFFVYAVYYFITTDILHFFKKY